MTGGADRAERGFSLVEVLAIRLVAFALVYFWVFFFFFFFFFFSGAGLRDVGKRPDQNRSRQCRVRHSGGEIGRARAKLGEFSSACACLTNPPSSPTNALTARVEGWLRGQVVSNATRFRLRYRIWKDGASPPTAAKCGASHIFCGPPALPDSQPRISMSSLFLDHFAAMRIRLVEPGSRSPTGFSLVELLVGDGCAGIAPGRPVVLFSAVCRAHGEFCSKMENFEKGRALIHSVSRDLSAAVIRPDLPAFPSRLRKSLIFFCLFGQSSATGSERPLTFVSAR